MWAMHCIFPHKPYFVFYNIFGTEEEEEDNSKYEKEDKDEENF